MFSKNQITALTQELDQNRIKSRQKGNISLSYLEGFDIIETANKIFGYGNWSYTISKLEQVSQEQNQNQNHVICYKALIKVAIHSESHSVMIAREDVGFGTGIDKTLAQAHEGAAKEAVTDALKRAMRSFGNQFGNSLYDKSRKQTQQPQPRQLHQAPPQQQNTPPQDYASLSNLGLTIMQQGNNLIVMGEDIFAKKDTIKACGFRWDGVNKVWYKEVGQRAA